MKALKLIGSKVWVALCVGVMAVALAIVCSGTAFAQDFSVTFDVVNGNGETEEVTTNVDIDGLIEDYSVDDAVYNMYYKSNAWNVLATTHYATFDAILAQAAEKVECNVDDIVWDSDSYLTLYVADNGGEIYTKYNPTYEDMTSCNTFYGRATNSDLTLTLPLATHTNPGAAFAWEYGSDVTGNTEIAGDAAERAVSDQYIAEDALGPRLIMGCSDGMTTETAMGKRCVYDIWGIILSHD